MSGRLESSCYQFRNRSLNPDSEDDVRLLLRGEGIKRLESFVFELLMQRALEHYCGQMPIAYGWYILPLGSVEAGLWIRMEAESPLGPCDAALLDLLRKRGCSVLKVRRSANGAAFTGSWHAGQVWGEEQDLDILLCDRFGSRGTVSQPKPASADRAEEIFVALFQRMRDTERRTLAPSRLLINCSVAPYTRSQPMDLDAVVLNDQGILKFVEFKRKYPAANMTFGVDVQPHAALIQPHAALIRWLHVSGHRLSNIVLADPCWNKNISPLHLLEGPAKQYVRWVGAHLDPACFEKKKLATTGADSGMFHFDRSQEAVRVGRDVDLGQSFAPSRLRAFLNDDETLPFTSARSLKQAKDGASAAEVCPKK
jgi:hypothetical protein